MNGAMLRLRLKYDQRNDRRWQEESEEKRASGVRCLRLTIQDGGILNQTSARIRDTVRTAINIARRDARQQNNRV